MTEVLRYRIRVVGLLVVKQCILLVRHEVGGDIHWIPLGDNFESECDESTKDTVRCEFFEEIGLRVNIGPLVCVCEFTGPVVGRLHMKLFYRIDVWRGESALTSLRGLGDDESDIRGVGWIARGEPPGLPSFCPAELTDDVWSRLDTPTPLIRHLGLRRQMLTASDRWRGS